MLACRRLPRYLAVRRPDAFCRRMVFRASIIDRSPLKVAYALRSTSCDSRSTLHHQAILILAKDIQLTEIKMHHRLRKAAVGSYSRLTIIARWRISHGRRAPSVSVQVSAGKWCRRLRPFPQPRQVDNAVAFTPQTARGQQAVKPCPRHQFIQVTVYSSG